MIEKILESAEKEVSKHKVTELEMIVELIGDKPYYSIRYFDISDMRWHIGYSSYDLKNVAEWKNECFEVVAKEYGNDTHSRCDTCTHNVADKVPPICYMCCKGIEDNYEQKGEQYGI